MQSPTLGDDDEAEEENQKELVRFSFNELRTRYSLAQVFGIAFMHYF